jgi:ABC-type Fe3+-citrate transport system substrate-binding protein
MRQNEVHSIVAINYFASSISSFETKVIDSLGISNWTGDSKSPVQYTSLKLENVQKKNYQIFLSSCSSFETKGQTHQKKALFKTISNKAFMTF